MRIYKINLGHTKFGMNWGSTKVYAINFEEAIRKAKKKLERYERIESIELLASAGGVWVGGQERYIPCNACGGTGYVRWSDSDTAREQFNNITGRS